MTEVTGWHHWLDGRESEWTREWWWTGRPGMLRFMGSQRVGHDWATELNWSELIASGSITSWQIEGGNMEVVTDLLFLASKITVDGDCSHEIKSCLVLGRKAMTSLSSDQFSSLVMFDSLRPHGLQHARPPCPSPTPRVYPNSCQLSWWCHPTISSSVVPFFSCHQSFPASDLFKWVSSSYQVAKVLEFQLQYQSFQWTLRTDLI